MSLLKACWSAPSNIALIKYWGKKSGLQLPMNPSISLTLTECLTKTSVTLVDRSETPIRIRLDGVDQPLFVGKIEQFINHAKEDMSFLNDYSLLIDTHNTFPHSSGIASSASSMAALALCLVELENKLLARDPDFEGDHDQQNFMKRASYYARIGSGSATRSIYGGAVSWGQTPQGHVDDYAVEIPLHQSLKNLCNSIAIVDAKEKAVSSTAGHSLMNEHPFAPARSAQALSHWQLAADYLAGGDWPSLGKLIELEALTLHAMMMTSSQSYLLMRPNTVKIIEAVRALRKERGTELFFTLDAGPNVHLLYLKKDEEIVHHFLDNQVKALCEEGRIIHDKVGVGPIKHEA